MNNPQNLIRLRDALQLVGVSAPTLERFIESSCLHVVEGSDGEKYLYRSELADLFQADDSFDILQEYRLDETSVALGTPAVNESQSVHEQQTELKDPPVQPVIERTFYEHTATGVPLEGPDERLTVEEKYQRLRKMLAVQKRLLIAREEELRDLKEQRDWLKGRVEKLEEQGDKDKILLLSETQTIKQLLHMHEPRKSTVRSLLEYFGFVSNDTSVVASNQRHVAIDNNRSNQDQRQ
jgi:hypothetical protein